MCMNFSCLFLQKIAFPPYSRLGPKVLAATLWKDFYVPEEFETSAHTIQQSPVSRFSYFFFPLLPASEFIWKIKKKGFCKQELETESGVISHYWKCVHAGFLAHWMFMDFYKIKPVFFEGFIVENPVHTSISEVWKKPQNPYSQPSTKAIEDYSWLCNWRFKFHLCLFCFPFGFSWNKTFFSGQKKVSVSAFFFRGFCSKFSNLNWLWGFSPSNIGGNHVPKI